MDVESKVWSFSGAGTRVHAFREGSALCRSNIAESYAYRRHGGWDWSEAKQSGFKVCQACAARFEDLLAAQEERDMNHLERELQEFEAAWETEQSDALEAATRSTMDASLPHTLSTLETSSGSGSAVTDAEEIRKALAAQQAAAVAAAEALKAAQDAAAAMETTRPPFWATEGQ